jgi:hypothetical protein
MLRAELKTAEVSACSLGMAPSSFYNSSNVHPRVRTMSSKLLSLCVLLLSSLHLIAQNTPAGNNPSPNRPGAGGGMQPCLHEAGIERSAMEQLMSAQRDMHARVQEVCSNSSLSPQEKRQKVQEIRQQAHQKIESFLTPDQQKKLTACRQQHGESMPGILSGAGGGGCGERPMGGHPGQNGAPGGGSANHPPGNQSSSPD